MVERLVPSQARAKPLRVDFRNSGSLGGESVGVTNVGIFHSLHAAQTPGERGEIPLSSAMVIAGLREKRVAIMPKVKWMAHFRIEAPPRLWTHVRETVE